MSVQSSDYVSTNPNNRFISTGSTPVTYDAAGNITQDMKFRLTGSLGMKYEYDANGRQSAAKYSDDTTLQTSVYDCSGQRVQTTAGPLTRTMVYDIFGQEIADYSYGSIERENIYRGGQLLATQEYAQTITQNVAWTNKVGVSSSGNSLTKTASSGWGNGGGTSTQAITSGDGYPEFTADSLDASARLLRTVSPSASSAQESQAELVFQAEVRLTLAGKPAFRGSAAEDVR